MQLKKGILYRLICAGLQLAKRPVLLHRAECHAVNTYLYWSPNVKRSLNLVGCPQICLQCV